MYARTFSFQYEALDWERNREGKNHSQPPQLRKHRLLGDRRRRDGLKRHTRSIPVRVRGKRREWPTEREREKAIAAKIILQSLSSVKNRRSVDQHPLLRYLPPAAKTFSAAIFWVTSKLSVHLPRIRPNWREIFENVQFTIHSPVEQIRADAPPPPSASHTHSHALTPRSVCLHRAVLSVSTVYWSFHSPPCSQLLSYIARPVWFLH